MRRGFTLMEMMVSVVLIVMITLFLSEAVTSLRFSNVKLREHDVVDENRSKLMQMIYKDLFVADAIEVIETENKRYDVVQLSGANSYYEMPYVYVLYYVKKEGQVLVRLESPKKITLPIPYEDRFRIKSDIVLENISDFSVVTQNTTPQTTKPPPAAINAKTPPADTNATVSQAAGSILLFIASQRLLTPIIFEIDRL
jgi:prepilin-type N-terminal cleavage/methylation domain-containing protein